MGLVSGYLCLAFMLLLMLKFPAKRLKLKNVDKFTIKIHKYAAALFLSMGILHFILVFKLLPTRAHDVFFSGFTALVISFVLVVLCHTLKDRKKEATLHRLFSFIILLASVSHIIFYQIDFSSYKMIIKNISVEEINLSEIPDGIYYGECDAGYIYARVKLGVKDGKLENAELLEHRNERGSEAESILKNIVFRQKLDVDAVTGATNSSLVIKKACENALKGK